MTSWRQLGDFEFAVILKSHISYITTVVWCIQVESYDN